MMALSLEDQILQQGSKFRLPVVQKGMKIGLFGGSFNPPHQGHVAVAQQALSYLQLDRVWWMVSPGNPLKDKTELRSVEERIALSQTLVTNPYIEITAFEVGLSSHYTIDTIAFLKEHYKDIHFVWIMGADSLAHFHLWHRWEDFVHMLPIAVLDRPCSTFSALSSAMATAFASYRVKEEHFASLALMSPPAWAFIHGIQSFESSTKLREKK